MPNQQVRSLEGLGSKGTRKNTSNAQLCPAPKATITVLAEPSRFTEDLHHFRLHNNPALYD